MNEFAFKQADYIVFMVSLVIAMVFAMAAGCTGNRQGSTEEILIASRQLRAVPVAFSMVASLLSGVFIIGGPAEVYYNGAIYALLGISWMLMAPIAAHLCVPIYRQIEGASIYEYIGKRFNTFVRVLAAIAFTIYMIFFLSVVIYAPALSFSHATGLPLWFSIALSGLICTKYTVVGGIKGVVWSETFQMLIIIASLLVLAIIGGQRAGGATKVWQIIHEDGRMNFNNINTDITERHTIWTQIIGNFFICLPAYMANQMIGQRYLVIRSTHLTQRAVYASVLIAELVLALVVVSGLSMYAFYRNCDPLLQGRIVSIDQLVPHFIAEILGEYTGLPGLFTAAIFSAALSSLSSAINAMAAVCLDDFIRPAFNACNRPVKEAAATILLKVLAFVFGILAIGLSYITPYLGARTAQVPITIWGIIGGPLGGLFYLAMFVPFANSTGAATGLIGGLLFSFGMCVLGILNKDAPEHLPMNFTCTNDSTYTADVSDLYTTTNSWQNSSSNLFSYDSIPPPEGSSLHSFYNISYGWYGLIGSAVTLFIGIIISLITCGWRQMRERQQDDLLANKLFFSCLKNKKKKDKNEVPVYTTDITWIEDGPTKI